MAICVRRSVQYDRKDVPDFTALNHRVRRPAHGWLLHRMRDCIHRTRRWQQAPVGDGCVVERLPQGRPARRRLARVVQLERIKIFPRPGSRNEGRTRQPITAFGVRQRRGATMRRGLFFSAHPDVGRDAIDLSNARRRRMEAVQFFGARRKRHGCGDFHVVLSGHRHYPGVIHR